MQLEIIFCALISGIVLMFVLDLLFVIRLKKYNPEIFQRHPDFVKVVFFSRLLYFFPKNELKEMDATTRLIYRINFWIFIVVVALLICGLYQLKATLSA